MPIRFSCPDGSRPLDGFTIEHGIGTGGFGEVYCAVSDVGKRVALKKIQRNLDIELRGVRHCINLKHINLIALWDIKTDDKGYSWVVMEYVPGPSLRDIVNQHPNGMPSSEVKRWFVSAASGVAYLHQQGIVHRDLKPGNIFLDNETQIIKIGDYGLAKFITASRREGQTESVGTFHYMAPEIGRGVYGKEIDIYALAIILFEMLTGDVPFDGESTQEIIMRHLTDDPRLDRVPAEYRDLIARSLSKDPADRYHTVAQMLADSPWPDVAKECQQIVSLQTVGSFAGYENHSAAAQIDAEESSLSQAPFTSPEAPANGHPIPESQILMAEVIDPEIVFGPVRDSQVMLPEISYIPHSTARQSGSALSSQGESTSDGPTAVEGHLVITDSPSVLSAGGQQSNPAAAVATGPWVMKRSYPFPAWLPGWNRDKGEPVAKAVAGWISDFSQWWRYGNVPIPIKLSILVVASLTLIINSAWLLPFAFCLGLIYLVYYAVRSWFLTDSTDPLIPFELSHSLNAGEGSPRLSRREKQKQLTELRRFWQQRHRAIQFREFIVSFVVSAVACGVFSLMGLAIGGLISGNSVGGPQLYGWFWGTGLVTSWTLMGISKFWESRPNEPTLRRISFLMAGTIVGLVSFFAANYLNVNLSDPYLVGMEGGVESTLVGPLVISGIPIFPAYLIFFTAFFGILRWWLHVDPLRTTRLSLVNVSLCLMWAVLFSMMLELPLLANAILAMIVSLSIQLASPWATPDWSVFAGKPEHQLTETAWGPRAHSR